VVTSTLLYNIISQLNVLGQAKKELLVPAFAELNMIWLVRG